ncbi:MAG TPA: hypothetical protein EYM99_13035 [Alphaproteobacteria bacterium]|nr:hypothetical protein [Alphaproteobacteria bacterium]
MDIIFPIIGGLFALAIPVLIIGGIIYLLSKLGGVTPIKFSFRAAMRIYFYVVLLISVGLFAIGGLSTLLKVGFGEIVGPEFSYGDVYEEHRYDQEERQRENYPAHLDGEPRTLPERIDLAIRGNLINGLSMAMIGLSLLVVHYFGRRWIETEEESSDMMRRIYLFAGLIIFTLVTLISLTAGIPETLRYALLENELGEESPGETLSIAIVALPIWLFYLIETIRKERANRT